MQDKWSDGDAYERYVGRWSRKVGKEFLAWLEPRNGARWLDLGCGTGALTARILADCEPAGIVGVEPSEAFLRLAGQRIADERVEFRQGGGDRIPLEDAAVDFAVSGLVLNFIPDQAKALTELRRVTAPGGTIAAYVWDYAGHTQFMRYFWDAAVAVDPDAIGEDEGRRFPSCRPQSLQQLFESAALKTVSVTAIDVPTAFANFDDYWAPFLSGVGPAPGYCCGLDESTRARLRGRLQQTLPKDPDGRILLAARAWAARGTTQ